MGSELPFPVSRYRLGYEWCKRVAQHGRTAGIPLSDDTVDHILWIMGQMEADLAQREWYEKRDRERREAERYGCA